MWILFLLCLQVAVTEWAVLYNTWRYISAAVIVQVQALRTEVVLFIPGFLSFYQVLFIFKHLFNLSWKMKTIASAAFYLSAGGVQADIHIKALRIFIIPDSVISGGVWQMHKSTTVSTWTLQWQQWLQTRIKDSLRKYWAFSILNNHNLLATCWQCQDTCSSLGAKRMLW